MADEPSIPMDQEEEDNDEYFSARESPGKKSGKTPTTTPQRSQREASKRESGKSKKQSQAFFSDENCHQAPEGDSKKKTEKVSRMLKDRNNWDMRQYKKEELEPVAKPKKTKKKKVSKKTKKQLIETQEKSKTDEESEEKDEEDKPSASPDVTTPQPRSFFQNEQLILKCKLDKPIAPKCKYSVLRFGKSQEVVEYDVEGVQHLLGHYNERAISNPWRRWGAHLALCGQGGFMVDKNKKIVEIKRGSDPPPCPPNPRQVTLNKNCEAPDSQTLMGAIKVEAGLAEDEVHRIGRVMEEYVKNGGFVPPPMLKKDLKPKGGQPQVVVQVKGGKQPKDPSAEKLKARKKTSKTKKKKVGGTGDDEDSMTDDDSVAEKAKKKEPVVKVQEVKPSQEVVRDDSKRGGGFSFFKRKKTSKTKGKGNNKGSIR